VVVVAVLEDGREGPAVPGYATFYLAGAWATLVGNVGLLLCFWGPNPVAALVLLLWATPYRRCAFSLSLIALLWGAAVLILLFAQARVGAYLWLASLALLTLGSWARMTPPPAPVAARPRPTTNPWEEGAGIRPRPHGPAGGVTSLISGPDIGSNRTSARVRVRAGR
jgi:hypothetical protein